MPRAEGFAIADVDTAKHTDPKFRRMWRFLNDEDRMNAAVVLYEAITLASWQQGERVEVDEAAPFWMPDTHDALLILQKVGLLDVDGRIPEKAWDSWYRPAYERREERRESGRRGGLAKAGRGLAEPERSRSEAVPVRTVPSVPTYPSEPSRAQARGGLAPIREVLEAKGLI